MPTLLTDLRYGARSLCKAPGFFATTVLLLSAGIGISTGIFTFVDLLLLKPLPYPDANRFVLISGVKKGEAGPVSLQEIQDWRQQGTSFARLCAVPTDHQSFTLLGGENPERILVARVSGSFFGVFGAGAVLGRVLLSEDDNPSGDRSVVFSYDLWRRAFGSDRSIIGRTVRLGGADYSVVGIMPESFRYPRGTDAWISAGQDAMFWNRRVRAFNAIGVLKPSVSLPHAEIEMDLIARRLEQAHPESNAGWRIRLVRLQDFLSADFRSPLLFLFGAALLVLLICCANTTGLMLARGIARRRELAIRLSLGAGRGALFRPLVSEVMIVCVVSTGIGVILARWALKSITGLSSGNLPPLGALGIHPSAFVFAALLSLLAASISVAALAFQIMRLDSDNVTKWASQRSGGPDGTRIHHALVVGEIALSLVLLVSLGTAVEGFLRLTNTDLGFDPHAVLTIQAGLPTTDFADMGRMRSFFDSAIERVSILPGVRAVGLTSVLPFRGGQPSSSFTIQGDPPLPPGNRLVAEYQHVDSGYFRAMRMRLLKGRYFDNHDRVPGGKPVVVMNRSAAVRFFGDKDPIGREISFGVFNVSLEIVGIIEDIRQDRLDVISGPQFFLNSDQIPVPSMTMVVRTVRDPATLAGAVREQLRSLDRQVVIDQLHTFDRIIAGSLWQQRLSLAVLVLFASVGVLLSAAGVYAVISYIVREGTHETGIRIAVGACPRQILQSVMIRTARLTALGLFAGSLAAVGVDRTVAGSVFGLKVSVLPICMFSSCGLLAVTLAAAVGPAIKAAKTDPSVILRQE